MTNPLLIEGFTVYRDDADEMARLGRKPGDPPIDTGSAKRFYVLPSTPTIATEPDGTPVFSLIVYRKDEDRLDPANTTEDVGGGIMTFTVELEVPDDKMKKIRTKLRSMVFGDDADDPSLDVELTPVQFLDGKVSIAVAGETAGGEDAEFVKGAVGTGSVSGIGGARKAVMVKLTQSGASLMSQLDKLRTLPINVGYDLSFEHRLVGVTMRVWCNMESSYKLMQEVFHEHRSDWSGYLGMNNNEYDVDKVKRVTEIMVREKTAGVTVIPATSQIDQDTLMSLEKFGFDLLNKELEKVVEAKPPPENMDRTYLEGMTEDKPAYYSEATNNFNFTLDRSVVLVQSFTPSANVSNVFQRADFDELVAFIDLRNDFFSFLKVPIRVNADFTALPIDSVTVTVKYQRERFGGGGREDVIDSFDFTDGSKIETFLAYANTLADVNYDWWAEVHYTGSPQTYTIKKNRVSDEFLVVDVGDLGMLSVDLGLGLVNTTTFPTAKVSVRYFSDALGRMLEQDFMLAEGSENAVWNEVVHEVPTKGFEYKVDWLRKDGDILTGTWTRTTSHRLRFDAPVTDKLDVVVLCSGNFTDPVDKIAQVAVALKYSDPTNAYTEEGHLVFNSDAQQQPWTIDLRNPQLRTYQYKYTIIYSGGVVKEFPEDGTWFDGDPGFITVGEKYTLAVDIYPTLLAYPDWGKVVQVDMFYDEAGLHKADSFVFNSAANAVRTWRVRGNPDGVKRYTYRISYFAANGTTTTVGPITQEAEALVVPPPVPPPPPPAPVTPTPPPVPVTPTPPPVTPTPPANPFPPAPANPFPPAPANPFPPAPANPFPPAPANPFPPVPVAPTPVTPTPATPVPPVPPG